MFEELAMKFLSHMRDNEGIDLSGVPAIAVKRFAEWLEKNASQQKMHLTGGDSAAFQALSTPDCACKDEAFINKVNT